MRTRIYSQGDRVEFRSLGNNTVLFRGTVERRLEFDYYMVRHDGESRPRLVSGHRLANPVTAIAGGQRA
jgi:hypothetical protein